MNIFLASLSKLYSELYGLTQNSVDVSGAVEWLLSDRPRDALIWICSAVLLFASWDVILLNIIVSQIFIMLNMLQAVTMPTC